MSRATAQPWQVVLIVEDDTDGRALRDLARASGFGVRIDWLPANGIGNIKRRGDALIRLARDRIDRGRGCVAVVVDRDGKDRGREEPHRTISRTCARQRSRTSRPSRRSKPGCSPTPASPPGSVSRRGLRRIGSRIRGGSWNERF